MSKPNSRLNRCYHDMIARCYNNKRKAYKDYGARGITICNEWLNEVKVPAKDNATKGWLAFKEWALSNGYSDALTLDRKDVDTGYSPNNCRWVDRITQANNTRRNHFITYLGTSKTLAQWCNFLGLKYSTVERRINLLKWPIDKALEYRK